MRQSCIPPSASHVLKTADFEARIHMAFARLRHPRFLMWSEHLASASSGIRPVRPTCCAAISRVAETVHGRSVTLAEMTSHIAMKPTWEVHDVALAWRCMMRHEGACRCMEEHDVAWRSMTWRFGCNEAHPSITQLASPTMQRLNDWIWTHTTCTAWPLCSAKTFQIARCRTKMPRMLFGPVLPQRRSCRSLVTLGQNGRSSRFGTYSIAEGAILMHRSESPTRRQAVW